LSEPGVDFDHGKRDALGPILESAAGFGLTADEIREAIIEGAERMPDDARALYVEELTRVLAARLLQKERSF
jgi:hypothetical protein